jgi:hypothetical protein
MRATLPDIPEEPFFAHFSCVTLRPMRLRLVALFLSLSACYRYTPISAVPNGGATDVRVRLTDAGSVALAPWIGSQVETLDGSVVTTADTTVVFAVSETQARNGTSTSWRGERVNIPRTAVAGFERRSLDKRKSWLIAGLTAAAVVVAQTSFNLIGSDSKKGAGPGPRPQ